MPKAVEYEALPTKMVAWLGDDNSGNGRTLERVAYADAIEDDGVVYVTCIIAFNHSTHTHAHTHTHTHTHTGRHTDGRGFSTGVDAADK